MTSLVQWSAVGAPGRGQAIAPTLDACGSAGGCIVIVGAMACPRPGGDDTAFHSLFHSSTESQVRGFCPHCLRSPGSQIQPTSLITGLLPLPETSRSMASLLRLAST